MATQAGAVLIVLLVLMASAEVPSARAAGSMSVVASVTVHGGPQSLAYDSGRGEVFVADSAYETRTLSP